MPQPLRFDSALLKPGDAEEIWRSALSPMYEIKRSDDALDARITTWDLGSIMLLTSHRARDEVQFQRTRRRIAVSGMDHYLVHCLLGGELISEFAAAQQRVPLRSVTIRDMAVENIGFARDAPMLTLSVPRAALDRRLPQGVRLHGASFAEGDPIGALVASHICSLADTLTAMTVAESKIAAEATLALLAACLLPKAEPDASRSDPRLAPMLKAHATALIEQRLADAELGPDLLCTTLKVSRTVLYEIFEDSGGIARYIRSRRLDEAMRRLVDPHHARHRIGEIAFSVGFSSEPTFNRAFRERFGCSPSEARAESEARGSKRRVEIAAGETESELVAKYVAVVRNLRG